MTAELVMPRGLPRTDSEPDVEFEEFYGRYYPGVLRHAWKIFGPADAEDIAQETMARALTNFDRLDPDRDPWPWLCVVARRVGTDMARSHSRTVSVEEQRLADLASADGETPFDQVQAKDDRSALRRALALLSPSDRRVLRLREYDDLSAGDIAALLDCSETAVRQQLFRARRRLAKRFRAVGGGDFGVVVPALVLLRSVRGRIARALGQATPAAASGGAMMTVALLAVSGGVTAASLNLGGPAPSLRQARPAVGVRLVGSGTDIGAAAPTSPAGGPAAPGAWSTTTRPGPGDDPGAAAPPVEFEVDNALPGQPYGPGARQHQHVRVAVAGRDVVRVDRENELAEDGQLVCDVVAPKVPSGSPAHVTCD